MLTNKPIGKMPKDEYERRTQCYKMLLNKGADLTLLVALDDGTQLNMFELDLMGGSEVSGLKNTKK
jgi:hypothetical protein